MVRLVPLAVVLLVLAAGCTAAPGQSGTTSTPTNANATSAPTTNETTATTSGTTNETTIPSNGRPPGVAADGSVNVTALLDANAAGLSAHGFALTITDRRSTNETATTGTQRVRATPHFARMRQTTRVRGGSNVSERVWLHENTTLALVRVERGGRVQYQASPVGNVSARTRARSAARFVGTRRLADLLRGVDFRVSVANASDGSRRYHLVGSEPSTDGGYGHRNVTMTVDADGVIRSLNASGSLSHGDTFAYGYRVTTLGVDHLGRPDWVASAPRPIDARPTVNAVGCSKAYLTVRNRGPDAIPPGTVVNVTANGTTYDVTLDSGLDAGDKRALYLDGSGALRQADVGSVPDSRTGFPSRAEVVVVTGDGLVLSNGAFRFGCGSANATADGGRSASGGQTASG